MALSELEIEGLSLPDPLFLRAAEAFGTTQKALSWLNASNLGFGGSTPRSIAQTEEGKTLVLGVPFDLEHGWPA